MMIKRATGHIQQFSEEVAEDMTLKNPTEAPAETPNYTLPENIKLNVVKEEE